MLSESTNTTSVISIPIKIKINKDYLNEHSQQSGNNNNDSISCEKKILLECTIGSNSHITKTTTFSTMIPLKSLNNNTNNSQVLENSDVNDVSKNNCEQNNSQTTSRIIDLAKSDILAQKQQANIGSSYSHSSAFKRNSNREEYIEKRASLFRNRETSENGIRKTIEKNAVLLPPKNSEYLEEIPKKFPNNNLNQFTRVFNKPTHSCVQNKRRSFKSLVMIKKAPVVQMNSSNETTETVSDQLETSLSKTTLFETNLPVKSAENENNKKRDEIVVQIFRDLLYLYRLDKQLQ